MVNKKSDYLIILLNILIFYFYMGVRTSLHAVRENNLSQIYRAQNIKDAASEANFSCHDGGYETMQNMADGFVKEINRSKLSDPTDLNIAFLLMTIVFLVFYFNQKHKGVKFFGGAINLFMLLFYFIIPQII